MACSAYNSTAEALRNFTGTAPIDAVTCQYSAGWGLGMGPTFLMFIFATMGLAMAIRTRHIGPVLVAGMLSAGVVAASLPGIVAKMFAFALLIGIAVAGLMLYQRAQGAL